MVAADRQLAGQAKAQDTVIGVYQGAKTVATNTRLDAESGAVFQVQRTQITIKTDKGVYRYTAAKDVRVSSPEGSNARVRAGDFVEMLFVNGQVAEVKIRKLVGVVAMVDTANAATEKRYGQAVDHRDITRITLKGRHGRWEVSPDVKMVAADGSPVDAVHGGDQVELTFVDGGEISTAVTPTATRSVRRRGTAPVSENFACEISEIKILKAAAADQSRVSKLVGIVSRVDTVDIADETRRDLVPGRELTENQAAKERRTSRLPREVGAHFKSLHSRDVTVISLMDKGTWYLLPTAKIASADGTTGDAVHVNDEVELTLHGQDIQAIKILKAAAGNAAERYATKVTGTIERVKTTTVPIEERNGQILKSKDVVQITMRDTGAIWELAGGAKVLQANGGAADGVHAEDEVELTVKGRLVTEVRILKR
jgi:hypothetical protein